MASIASINRSKLESILKAALIALGIYDIIAFFQMNLLNYIYYAVIPTAAILIITYAIYRSFHMGIAHRSHYFETYIVGGDEVTAINRLKDRISELENSGQENEELLRLKLILANLLLRRGEYPEVKKILTEVETLMRIIKPLSKDIIIMYNALKSKIIES
ncbi:hypothetical protein [Vulcanisaeta sp. JCM 16161]|uniref:hypothetical protein n=1 Tax=Vulcanisaeta sp. JCM 16161 TaxID=1295372 RepID=UPI000B15D3CE|nr:hypothetical protein [Vulcanisaeta sp. JCM 16161]